MDTQDQSRDFDSLRPPRIWGRRGFVAAGLGSGFAAAVLPVSAQTIKTPADGLDAGQVEIDTPQGRIGAYCARPVRGKDAPLVLVVSEIFGVHEHIADVTRRFAKLGMMAVAPDLFGRFGDPRGYTDIPKLQADIISKVPDADVMSDLDATLTWAGKNGADTSRAGITGFCWGGRITWLYSAHQPKMRAGVAWYGRLVGNATALTPKHPVDVAGDLKAPVLGLYGGADAGIPQDTIDKMTAALAAGSPAAKQSEFVVYPDAPHAFHADYRSSYREDEARKGWARCLAWFKTHGVA